MHMEQSRQFVVTKQEALNILGIRKASLTQLERVARISGLPDRHGYTAVELKRLLAKLKRILGR